MSADRRGTVEATDVVVLEVGTEDRAAEFPDVGHDEANEADAVRTRQDEKARGGPT